MARNLIVRREGEELRRWEAEEDGDTELLEEVINCRN